MTNLKMMFFFLIFPFLLFTFTFSCGSSTTTDPAGPNIDIAELETIIIDQIKFSGGTDDDQDLTAEASVYIRCAANGQDMACSGSSQGLNIVEKSGVVYGRLNARFVGVEDAPDSNCSDVQLVFVEKDSNNCPQPITSDDDIVWTSDALSLDEEGAGNLLKSKIANSDSSVMAYLIGPNDEPATELLLSATPLTENKLMLDQLYFKSPSIEGLGATFKAWVRDEQNNFRCEASFNGTSGVTLEDIIYGNLGIELLHTDGSACSVTDENKLTKVKVYFYVSTGDTTYTTEENTTLVDLVDNDGGREEFGDNGEDGFIRFYPIDGAE